MEDRQREEQFRDDRRSDDHLLVHVTTTVEHIQLLLEHVDAIKRLSDESVLIRTREGEVVVFPDLEGPVLIDDHGTVTGDSRYVLRWSDGRTAAEVYRAVLDMDRFDDQALRAMGFDTLHENPSEGRNIDFCSVPASEN